MTAIAVTIAGSTRRRRWHPGRPQNLLGARRLWRFGDHRADRAEHAGVTGIHDVPPDFVTAQIDAVFSDLAVDAVKIGMLSRPEAIEAVAAGLDRHGARPVVLDPVMVATLGDRLLKPEAVEALRTCSSRSRSNHADLPEAAALLEPDRRRRSAMRAQAERLLARGAKAVLIKGGHGERRGGVDLLVSRRRTRFAAPRIKTRNTHGTGCTLSSAIAAGSPRAGISPRRSRGPRTRHRRRSLPPTTSTVGSGHGPVHHFIAGGEHRRTRPSMERAHDEHHPTNRLGDRSNDCSGRSLGRPRPDPALAHGHLMAQAPARPGHVRGARRRTDKRLVRRPFTDRCPRRGRGRSGVRSAPCGRLRRCRNGPHRRAPFGRARILPRCFSPPCHSA